MDLHEGSDSVAAADWKILGSNSGVETYSVTIQSGHEAQSGSCTMGTGF